MIKMANLLYKILENSLLIENIFFLRERERERSSRCVLSNLYNMYRQFTTYIKQDAIITIR